jgi:outer membrane protein, heavy metal efflux system
MMSLGRRSRIARATAFAAALAAGCRHVAPAPISPEQNAARLEQRSLADPALRDFLAEQRGAAPEPWPQQRWDLSDLTVAALFFSPDLHISRAQADVAAAQIETASQRPNPTLSVAPQRVVNPESGLSPWLTAVQLDWPIETAGKRAERRAAAQARADAADHAIRTAWWRVRDTVYQGVVGTRAADARCAVLARTLALRRERLELLERQRAAGEIAGAIAAPARIALAQGAVDLAAAERQRAQARAALAASLGLSPEALEAVEVVFELDAPPGDLEALGGSGARRAALVGRSDVLAALAEYDAAEADLRLELAKQIPDLHLGPTYEYDQGEDKWGLTLSLDLPLMNRNEGGIEEAVARRGEAAARFEALQVQVIGEVAAASAALAGARREEANARELLAEAQRGVQRAQSGLEHGAADRGGLVDAQLEEQVAAGALIDSHERVHLAVSSLERAVEVPGSGTSP